MRLLVRTWNLFHGRTHPESRRVELERMVRLVSADRPDLVCLQEVPLWALGRLESWSGMQARATVTKRALLGPLAEGLQRIDPARVRSPLTGQANAMLIGPGLQIAAFGAQRLNPGVRAERRMCQLARLRVPAGELGVVNLHATNRADAARHELELVERLVDGVTPVVVAGDLNVRRTGLPGFCAPLPGIDQILVRGLGLLRGPEAWPDERRRAGPGRLLSDHAPVEAEIMVP